MMTEDKLKATKTQGTIKLGIDAHAKWCYVARQLDGVTPQPVLSSEAPPASDRVGVEEIHSGGFVVVP